MKKNQLTVSRRSLLNYTLAASLAGLRLPVFDFLLNESGTAFAQGNPLPGKFGLFFFGNGISPSAWVPAKTGQGNDWQLSDALSGLASVKDYINVISGLDIPNPDHRNHGAALCMLSGSPAIFPESGTQHLGPTIDQEIAEIVSLNTPIKSLELGISERLYFENIASFNSISVNKNIQYNTIEYSPVAAFSRLFKNDDQASLEETKKILEKNKSILDYSLQEANRLMKNLGTLDREKMSAHMEGIRMLESKISAFEKQNAECRMPDIQVSFPGTDMIQERMDLMSDLAVKALECSITNVVSIQFSGIAAQTEFTVNGRNTGNHHGVSHQNEQMLNEIVKQIITHLGSYLEKLKNVSIGSGNLLDQMLVYSTSDLSGVLHQNTNMPVLLAGSAGGRLKFPSQHLAADGQSTSLALMTIMRAVCGSKAKASMGHGIANTNVALDELLV